MKLRVINDYGMFLDAVRSFGYVGPVFYYENSGATYISAFVDNNSIVEIHYPGFPASLLTDFPNAKNVRYAEIEI